MLGEFYNYSIYYFVYNDSIICQQFNILHKIMKKGKNVKNKEKESTLILTCPDCHKTFNQHGEYAVHLFHCDKKNENITFYECPKCKSVMLKEEEKDHVLAHELEEKIQNNIKNGYESDASKASQLTSQLKEQYCYSLESVIESNTQITKENKNCIICLIDLNVGDRVITLPCFHMFHKECINDWFKKDKKCPLCKLEIKVDEKNDNNNVIPEKKEEHREVRIERDNNIEESQRSEPRQKNKELFRVNNSNNRVEGEQKKKKKKFNKRNTNNNKLSHDIERGPLLNNKRPRSRLGTQNEYIDDEYDDSFWRFPIIYPDSPRKKKRMLDSDSY